MRAPPPVDRRLAGAFSAALCAAVLAPLAQHARAPAQRRDGFPLSYYPMFSAPRGRTKRQTYLVGVDAAGGRRRLPYTALGGGGLNQARRQMSRLVSEGKGAALAAMVAGRVADGGERWSDVVGVEVVTGSFRLDDVMRGRIEPLKERLRGAAAVPR